MRKFTIPLLRFVCVCFGSALLLYPWLSNHLAKLQAESVIAVAEETAESLEEEEKNAYLAAAEAYNEALQKSTVSLTEESASEEESALADSYELLLSYAEDGVIGWVEVPAIDIMLPVYLGTDETVLSAGIGHLEGSSLPIGGESTHAVLVGHTGNTSSKLFTDLTEMAIGDCFYFHILGQVLSYQVTEISVVEPEDTSKLQIVQGEDLMTLLTCTPYGVNSHRLLVTGSRISDEAVLGATTGDLFDEDADAEDVAAEESSGTLSPWQKLYRNALLLAALLIAAVGIICFLFRRRQQDEEEFDEDIPWNVKDEGTRRL